MYHLVSAIPFCDDDYDVLVLQDLEYILFYITNYNCLLLVCWHMYHLVSAIPFWQPNQLSPIFLCGDGSYWVGYLNTRNCDDLMMILRRVEIQTKIQIQKCKYNVMHGAVTPGGDIFPSWHYRNIKNTQEYK